VTEIKQATHFYEAEAYHQDYYKTNAAHYQAYRQGSGRAAYIRDVWEED
jgi:peptide methionine sulfoxide reductase MsrA